MSAWILPAEVLLGCPDLASDIVAPVLDALIAEAETVVVADLEGWYDIDALEPGQIPLSIKRLAVTKARELGYRKWYGPERPTQSEVDAYRRDYDRQIVEIRAGRVRLPGWATADTGTVGYI